MGGVWSKKRGGGGGGGGGGGRMSSGEGGGGEKSKGRLGNTCDFALPSSHMSHDQAFKLNLGC